MSKRIVGIDLARAMAVIGMIIVNFKIVLGAKGNNLIIKFIQLLEGKAAATFVVLAGIGMALMSNKAILTNDIQKIKKIKLKIIKRALFLFIIGLLYIPIWQADILHFYGVYMMLSLLLLTRDSISILSIAALIIIIYPLFLFIWDFDIGWDFKTFTYTGFWTFNGFIRNLFYNGFHPVFPWVSFMLIGLWFGKQNLNDSKFVKKSLFTSLSIFIFMQLISYFFSSLFSDKLLNQNELNVLFGTSPMPPLPIYMISGSSISIFIISFCILLAKKYDQNFLIKIVSKTGHLAFTFYVAHVIIGIGIIELIQPERIGNYTIEFSLIYALVFSLLCVLFTKIWTKYNKTGPLEWFMRKLTT